MSRLWGCTTAGVSIHKWKLKYGKEMTQKESKDSKDLEELKRLRRENIELKKVNYILKSATAFFSQDHLK